jgi:hypothetical protein
MILSITKGNYWFVLFPIPLIGCWHIKNIRKFIHTVACFYCMLWCHLWDFTSIGLCIILENLGICGWSLRFQQFFNHLKWFFHHWKATIFFTLVMFTVHNSFQGFLYSSTNCYQLSYFVRDIILYLLHLRCLFVFQLLTYKNVESCQNVLVTSTALSEYLVLPISIVTQFRITWFWHEVISAQELEIMVVCNGIECPLSVKIRCLFLVCCQFCSFIDFIMWHLLFSFFS